MSKMLMLILKQNYFGDTAQNLAMLVIDDVYDMLALAVVM
jgi:hypothetical protein